MGLFGNQLANVVEWEEYRDDIIFWKWTNREIKKGSRLIIRAGQDAIFMYNGKIEGIFTDEGSFDIESQIIPFLSTLKGFKFGFNSGIRAEVLFVNTKEFTVKWGTKNPVAIPTMELPGGMPIRAYGTFSFKVSDYLCLIDKVAGVKKQYCVDDVKERVVSVLDSLLMRWISKEGRNLFSLQDNAMEIGDGIKSDLDMEMSKIGITITDFTVSNFSYTEEVQKMQNKVASQAMIGNMDKYTHVAMADSVGKSSGTNAGLDMAGMQMGMMMGQQMVNSMNQNIGNTAQPQKTAPVSPGKAPKFCPECGTPTNGAKFCPECGTKLQ
ncbi:MAG: SPFH domain-containing protein [Clostridia bacterium]|nr:SPFH domain-containing protein [Clostridia bacterium]